jgi:hypothetical protein
MLLVGQVSAFRRFPGRWPQTLIGRLEVLRGWDLDADLQFFADADAGLRGYVLYGQEGSRRVLANLEHRISSGTEILQILAPGAAVFVDAGGAVPEGREPRWEDVKSDVGVGLRIALPRAAAQDIIRIDLAFPLAPDRNGERTPLFSVAGSQAF